MSVKTLDLRGLSCPQPVFETKKAIEDPSFEELEILVDTRTSVENITRLVKSKGNIKIKVDEGDDYRIRLQIVK